MNRVIKFRAWDKTENRRIKISGFRYQSGDLLPMEYRQMNGKIVEWTYVDDFVLQQFTGLKDRNKTELYEGDIITNSPINKHLETDMWYEIYWNGRWSGRIITHHSVCGGSYIDDISKIDMQFFERIGNIHEHKNLLATGKG